MDVFKATPYQKKSKEDVFKATPYKKIKGLEPTASQYDDDHWDKYKEFANSEEATQGWQKYLEDQEAKNQAAEEEKEEEKWWEKIGRWLGSGGAVDTSLPMGTTTQAIHSIRDTGLPDYTQPEDDWEDEQRNIFGYLYSTNPSEASEYAKHLNTVVKEKAAIQNIQDSATSGFWAGTGNTVGAIATAPLGLADFLNDLVLANAGVSNTRYDGQVSPFEYSQAVTGGISENLNENGGTLDESIPIIGGKGWGDLYGLGTSIVQSGVSGATLGGMGTLVSYFGQGAASGVDDAMSRGATEEQAITYGALVGLAEGIAESIGVEKLFKMGASPTKKVLIKNIVKQAGAEGVEEGITSIMSNAIDNVVMQDKSNFNAMVNAYVAQGMTMEEAQKKAWMDSIEGILYDSAGGFVSGGVHGGVRTGVLSAIDNHNVKQTYGDNKSIQDLLSDAVNTGGDAANVADKLLAKYGKKGKLSGANLNELIHTTDITKMKLDIEAKLTEHGETGDISAITDILVRQAMGEELSSKDWNTLNNSKAGHLVSAQLNEKNIKSGALNDDWATYIGTERLNPRAYNRGVYDLAKMVQDMNDNSGKASVAKELAESGGAEEAEIKVSDNGKNMYYDAEAKEYVDADIKRVVSTKGGIEVELDNGKTVKTSDIEYASREEGVMYEMLARMDVTPDTANEIINTFKPSNTKQAELFFDSIPLAYRMGLMGNEQGLKYINLPDAQKRIIYNRGRIDATINAKERDNARATSPKKATAEASKTGKNGIIYEGDFVYDEATSNDLQKAGMAGAEAIAKTTNLEVHVFASFVKDGNRVAYVNGKLVSAPNGYFTGGNKIYIDINAGMNAEGAMLYALAHEVTHYIRKWNAQGFKDLADFLFAEYGKHGVDVTGLISRQKDKIKKRRIEEAIASIKEQYKKEGKAIPDEAELQEMAKEALPDDAKLFDMAYEELVADAMSDMLADPKAYEKLAKFKKKNFKAWKKLGEIIKQVLDKLKNALNLYKKASPVAVEAYKVRDFSQEAYNKLQDLYIKAFAEADANYEASGGEATDLDGNEGEHLFSDKSMIEGAGLQFIINENGSGYKVLDKEGKPVKSVTADMIVDSPLGNLVTMAKNEGYLGKGKEATIAANKQYKFLAELVNMCINYNGIAPIWETAGTMVFSSMKSNADKQYGLTIDFSTVCKKTQAIVDAMSEAMLRLGRGLTRSEVETIYLEVGKAGESTPCPVCYVFSRWMGIGGILDQISRFQDKYSSMSEKSLQKFIADIQERIEEAANTPDKNGNLKPKFFTGKGAISEGQVIADLKSKASSKAASALKAIANNSNTQLEIQELEALMEAQNPKEARKTAAKIKQKKAKLTDVSALEKEMRDANDTLEEYEAYQWLTRTLMMESDGKWIKNSAFKPVPKDILFDLNKGDKFAEGYPLSWAFRTGKGASAGKAIVPYADARVGEAIQSVANQSPKDIKIGLELNPFLNSDTAGRLKILKSAIAKQARQNLLGGQRYQSTSDFRYEYGSDYLITFLEMQAIGAKVQLYTKVIEAVDFLASMGADCNLSVMPLSDGFITLPDGTKKLVYSSVTGINAEAAIKKSHEYNNVQLILVGISDEHIRLALEGTDVTFVIPFHGSGNSVHQIQALMNLLGENLDVTTAQDYTLVQSDHVSPHQTKEQKAMWNLRGKIVRGEAFPISVAEQTLLDKNPYLNDLYRRFYLDKNADEYGVGLTSDQSKQIFPYEYWDKSLTYAQADKNGERFKEYCASMGIIPRFSGINSKGEYVGFGDFSNDKGYWKLLIDRPMYDNTYDSEGNWTGYGKYHEQARINCSNFQVKHLDPEYGSATYGEVMSKENDPKKTNKIVDAALKQFENNTINDVRTEDDTQFSDRDSVIRGAVSNIYSGQRDFDLNEVIEHTTDVVNSIRFSDRDDVTNTKNTYMKIGKEMMAYAEGDRKPDLTLVEVYNERTGKTETTIKFVGDKPKDYIPRKIAYCYKLFEQHPDGTLHALFAGASNATPVGEWVYSKGFPYTDSGVKGMNLRERYGWHLSAGLPSAPHLMSSKEFERGYPSKNAYGHPKGSKRVWVRMAYDATTDFNSIADSTTAGDIFGLIPFGGYYAFKENNQSEWVISSAVKIDKILKEEERQQILKDAGYDEYEAWRKKHRATEAEKAESKRKSAENKKAKDNAKKAGLNYLSESAKEMREAINSRIIDNPELSDIHYSDREIQPVTDAEYERLKKHFGTTGNFNVAGYLLPDGKLLDFSGKHWGDTTSRSRQVDHRDVQEVLERGNNGISDMVDMIGSGCIRLMPETGGINLAVYPNEKQRRVLSVYIKQMLATEGQVIIDYDAVGGDTVHSRVYEKYASSTQILSDIRNYFNGARQSDLMSFHTMYSDRDNIGYHAGDLGKAEFLYQQGRYRGTGHFGTGTYFVGEEERISGDNSYGKRPHHAVDFSNYNLYKIKDNEDGWNLHEQLREIDGGFSREWLDAAVNSEFSISNIGREAWELQDKYDVRHYDEELGFEVSDNYREAQYKAYTEIANKYDVEHKSYEEWLTGDGYDISEMDDFDIDYYKLDYAKYLGNLFKEIDDTENDQYRRFRNAVDRLRSRFGYRKVENALREVLKYQEQTRDDRRNFSMKIDSFATVFMKSLGYEGIDVRGTRLDNVEYGSVIYDIKDDTIIYSDRDTDAVSNRTLLANALESVAQNDIEKAKLAQYKKKIALIEAEQRKLNDIKARANAIRFTKGRTSAETKQMHDLDFEATQTANRINTYDKQLLNLESTSALKNVLEREKTILRKRLEKQGKEALKAQSAKNAETVREIMTRNTASRKKAVEGRHKTEMKRDIKKLLQRLNKLFKGGKERNVKEGMKEAVSTALALGDILFSNEISNLDIVNLGVESVTEKESKHLDEYRDLLMKKESNLDRIRTLRATLDADNKEQVYEYISELEAQNRKYDRRMSELNGLLADVFVRERARLNRMPVNTLIDELASEYQKLKSAKEDYIKIAYDSNLYDMLVSLKEKLGGVIARDMSLEQLERVKKVFTMLEHSIRTANQEFRNGKWEDLQQSASAVMEEIEPLRNIKQEGASSTSTIRSFLWNELTPYYAFDKIGSKTLMAYFKDLMRGQAIAARDSAESKAFAQATREKYNYSKWKLDEIHEFQLNDGRTFSTTLKHLLSVYAYSKREQADLHMSVGGFFHNDKATFRKKKGVLKMVRTDAVGYKVDANVLEQIKTVLGNERMSYVDEMLEYLTKMGEKGNEVTRVMWGVDIFTEKVYFPLKSKEDFLKKSTETAQAVSLKNDGMTKETVPGASNPIVLEAFDDVWANHVERMSVYHGFVIPIDNLNKVLHYGTWVGTDAMSVSTMLEGKFSSACTDYLEQFIKDLNGGAVVQGATNPFMSFFAKFKKTAVGASLSTIVQQPTAILRAMAEIDAKYFVGKPHLTKLSERLEELKTYAPIAIIKEIGGFDAGGSKSIARWINSDTLTGIDKVMNTIDDISMKGAEYADWIGWLTIWEAVKRETKATTDLALDSKEFFDKCGERFEEVIMKTQVYDSTLSRSGFMRSKNEGVKMLTSFMGEPTLSINMLYSAVLNAFRGGEGAKLKAAKTIGYVYLAMIFAEALSSAIYALRDDDEDESYMEKYLQSLGSGVISDIVLAPVTSLPGVKDIVSIFQGWDVERSDMAIFKDIKDAFDGLDSESKSPYRKVEDFAGAIAAAFGLPLKNVLRTGREVYNAGSHVFDDVSGGSAWDAFVEGVTGESTPSGEKLYKAITKGKSSRLESYKKGYKTEKAYETAVRKALRDNDPRIKEAAQARYDGDISKYTRIAKEIIAEGNFSQDDVVAAINSEMSAIKNSESTENDKAEDKDEETSIYKASDINSAFENGDNSLATEIINDLVETKVANGMTEKEAKSSLRSSMTSYWKPLYKEAYSSRNNTEMARIRRILYSSELYGTSNDVVKTTQNWLKD